MSVFDNPDDDPAEFPAHDHEDHDPDGYAPRSSTPQDFVDLPETTEEA
jgi:hypothetical protein